MNGRRKSGPDGKFLGPSRSRSKNLKTPCPRNASSPCVESFWLVALGVTMPLTCIECAFGVLKSVSSNKQVYAYPGILIGGCMRGLLEDRGFDVGVIRWGAQKR
jgi:hypothetical protein